MNKDKVYLKGYVIGRAVDTLGYEGLMVQLENLDVVEIDKNLVHRDINEPQKVTVPQFVADWYENHKDDFETCLFRSIDLIPSCYEEGELSDFEEWLVDEHTKPFQTLVNMHQFGYDIEKEKRYFVRLKHAGISNSLLKRTPRGEWWFGINFDDESQAHTRKELEAAGFGEVFNSPLFEVEEVD